MKRTTKEWMSVLLAQTARTRIIINRPDSEVESFWRVLPHFPPPLGAVALLRAGPALSRAPLAAIFWHGFVGLLGFSVSCKLTSHQLMSPLLCGGLFLLLIPSPLFDPVIPPHCFGLIPACFLFCPAAAPRAPRWHWSLLLLHFDPQEHQLLGPAGQLPVLADDEVTRKLALLIDGECHGSGPLQAARHFGFSKQRYFQLRQAYRQGGAAALKSKKRGPQGNYRRTNEVVRQVIRHRFLDPDATPAVIAQKLTQAGWIISIRSVERVIEQFGLQKKTPSLCS
jgi:hypothetical protein